MIIFKGKQYDPDKTYLYDGKLVHVYSACSTYLKLQSKYDCHTLYSTISQIPLITYELTDPENRDLIKNKVYKVVRGGLTSYMIFNGSHFTCPHQGTFIPHNMDSIDEL